ncbi:MAG: hypothetical protein ACJ73D_13575 [Pyrinomonadaceae bacterium]
MKRLEEKVKDIVEVRAFAPLQDFAADPAQTLASYRFTDITSDLMAKWLERAGTATQGVGIAAALAGFRGVGKSHFFATVGAILARPELRGSIPDDHVKLIAEGLPRRPYLVAHVRRGSEATLLDELRIAVAQATGTDLSAVGTTVAEILQQASSRAGEQAFVLFFDTAAGRETRVARDDGPILSEAAEIGKSIGMFVGVALDDDIAGADGANSSIARSFQIDYLDQEHVFKIVDTHIFAKESRKVPLLREVYDEWRQVLPGFRWSEQRFISLYPMHPATLELAPLIRLYLQEFALLRFASEAGVKILGRPANSLIGLDEMFDSVESKLRHVAELKDAFDTFDHIERDVISKAPVATRLPAKLILKGLFLLSLDGQGASASEIAAAMMIYGPGMDVESVLQTFFSAGLAIIDGEKYRLRSGGTNVAPEVLKALDVAAAEVLEEDVWTLLLKQTSEKFSDVVASEDFGREPSICTVEWRGALRRGEILWRHETFERESTSDWMIFVERRGATRLRSSKPILLWRVAGLTDQERSVLRRYHVLRTDATIREGIGDGLATQMQIHSIATERIWQRVFLQEARLVNGANEYELVDATASAHTLSQVLSRALTPYFESLYPQHPLFTGRLGPKEASTLVANFFGGAAPEAAETRRLVDTFAAPLGLGVSFDSSVIPTNGEELMRLPIVKAALGDAVSGDISLRDIEERLSAEPLGLTREARRLVLAALVAQRQFDFVTASGNRINHRSLDLQIIWDDIQGIATPRSEDFAVERLLSWAKVLTGNNALTSIDRGEDRRQIVESLAHWLETWEADNTLVKFDLLPDEQLNTAVWKLAAGLKRTFGAAADTIRSLVQEETTLVECLKAIAEQFNDSEADHELKTEELAILNKYVLLSAGRGQMLTYIASTDWTGDDAIDSIRRELLDLAIGGGVALNGKNDRIAELWVRYLDLYSAHFAAKHSEVMASAADTQVLRDVMSSDLWSAFRGLADLPLIGRQLIADADDTVRRIRGGGCTADAAMELTARPVCTCGNGLKDLDQVAELPSALRKTIESGIAEFRTNVVLNKDRLIQGAARTSPGPNIGFLIDSLEKAQGFPRLDGADILLLKRSCSAVLLATSIPDADVVDAEIELLTL